MIKLDYSKQIGKKIPIKRKTNIFYVNEARIRYIIYDKHYCYFYLAGVFDCEEIRVKRSLKFFEDTLIGDGFVRINYNTLANARYFTDIHLVKSQRTLHITGGKDGKIEPHIVSKRRVHQFRDDF